MDLWQRSELHHHVQDKNPKRRLFHKRNDKLNCSYLRLDNRKLHDQETTNQTNFSNYVLSFNYFHIYNDIRSRIHIRKRSHTYYAWITFNIRVYFISYFYGVLYRYFQLFSD